MRILMLSWEYPPNSVGGLARHVQDLSETLAEQGEEIHVLTQGERYETEIINGVHVHRVESYPLRPPDFLVWVMQLNLRFLEEGCKLLREKRYDVVHAHDWLSAFSGRGLKHAFRLPLAATIHATESGRNQGLHNPLQNYIHSVEWWLAYEAWKVIVCSKHMKYEVQGLFNLPVDKTAVIPNGVKLDNLQLQGKKGVSYQPLQVRVIFYVGRLVREKGIQVLLQAAPRILGEFPGTRLIIAGKGPMEGELQYLARSLKIEHSVQFMGYVDDRTRNELYSQASAAVFPSLYEPFGIVALESMATGTPVVVADTGGFHEIVEHGVNGMKAYVGDANSLADNILALFYNRDLAKKIAVNGLELVRKHYSWDKIAEATREVYANIRKEYRHSSWPKENLISNNVKHDADNSRFLPGSGRYSLVDRRLATVNLKEGGGNH